MKKITLKFGFVIFGISLILLAVEFFISMILGMAGGLGYYIDATISFIILLTAAIGILAPVSGMLNKKEKINITWKLFILFSFILTTVIFIFMSRFGTESSYWHQYSRGGSYLGSNPVFSSDGKKFIFSSPSTGHGDIYEMDINGLNKKKLTTTKNYEGQPVYSPDGSKICYVRESWDCQIYIMDSNGENQKQLTSGSAVSKNCSFSPDNKQVVFKRTSFRPGYQNGIEEFCIINADGTNQKCLKNDNIDDGSNVVFSPQGDSIYYYIAKTDSSFKMTAAEIWKQNINTLETQLISTISGEIYDIKFSPDFKKIVYIAWQGNQQQHTQIYIANIDGTSAVQLTNTKEYKSAPSFSPDGSRIIFLSTPQGGRGGNDDIISINSDGSGLKIIGSNK